MIVWRGRGILAFVIGFGILILMNQAVDGIGGHGYFDSHIWPGVLSGVLAAAPIWILGKRWNEEDNGLHTLFYIPMQFWAIGALLLGFAAAMPSSHASAPEPVKTSAQSPPEPQRIVAPAVAQTTQVTQASVVAVPEPLPETRRKPVPQGRPEMSEPTMVRVYADTATKQYYPENCPGHPASAYLIARTVVKSQGYTLAAGCSE